MRTKDLVKGKAYATCNGTRVEPVEPIHPRHVMLGKRVDGEYVTEITELDPWGPCHREPGVRVMRRGVKVKVYQVDGDGEKVGEGKLDVIRPQDIAGTWGDYMVTHGERLAERARQVEIYEQIKEKRAELIEAAKKLGFSGEVHVSANKYIKRWGRERHQYECGYQVQISIEFKTDTDDIGFLDEVLTELKRKRSR